MEWNLWARCPRVRKNSSEARRGKHGTRFRHPKFRRAGKHRPVALTSARRRHRAVEATARSGRDRGRRGALADRTGGQPLHADGDGAPLPGELQGRPRLTLPQQAGHSGDEGSCLPEADHRSVTGPHRLPAQNAQVAIRIARSSTGDRLNHDGSSFLRR